MKQPLLIKNTIVINAPASKVWDALVNPEQTKKYMFGCETICDWQPGSGYRLATGGCACTGLQRQEHVPQHLRLLP